MTWEKLALELELLRAEDPNSLMPLILGLNTLIDPMERSDSLHRSINFMCYELVARCENLSESERVDALIQYFFNEKGFSSLPLIQVGGESEHLFVRSLFDHRMSHSLTLTILFLHFANHLDLPIYAVHLRNNALVKWVRSGQSTYFDLLQRGARISEESLLPALSHNPALGETSEDISLEILPNRKIFYRYLKQLAHSFRSESRSKELLTCLNVKVTCEPNNTQFLAERALLNFRLGFVDDAQKDFKRYFSFIDADSAPREVYQAYVNLERFVSSLHQENPTGFLH